MQFKKRLSPLSADKVMRTHDSSDLLADTKLFHSNDADGSIFLLAVKQKTSLFDFFAKEYLNVAQYATLVGMCTSLCD